MSEKALASPFAKLAGIINEKGQGLIVLCGSNRAAALLKMALLKDSASGCFLGVEVISASELIAALARETGVEEKVIGGLGREILLGGILSGIKRHPMFEKTDLTEYISGFSRAISELKQAGVKPAELGKKAGSSPKLALLAEAYKEYELRLMKKDAIDTSDLSRTIFDSIAGHKLPHKLRSSKFVAFCTSSDKRAAKIVERIREKGIEVEEIAHQQDDGFAFKSIKTIKARGGKTLARETARLCKSLKHASGCEYHDICVLVPLAEGKDREIAQAMEWAGVPCTEPVWLDLSEHPAASSLISLMSLASRINTMIDIFEYCSQPYYGMGYFMRSDGNRPYQSEKENRDIDPSAPSRIQRLLWVKSKPLLMEEWGDSKKWGQHFRPIVDEDIELDALRGRFYEWCSEMRSIGQLLNADDTWEGHCKKLLSVFDRYYRAKVQLFREDEDPKSTAVEYKAIDGIADVIRKAQDAYRLLGESSEKVGWAEFSSTIADAFRQKRLMLRGSSKVGVAVAKPSEIGGLKYKHIVFYDMSEASYPSGWNPVWALNEKDRRVLTSFNDDDIVSRNAMQKSNFLRAANSCSESLSFMIPSIGSDEKPVNASLWALEVLKDAIDNGIFHTEQIVSKRLPAPASIGECITEAEHELHIDDISYARGSILRGFVQLKKMNEEDADRLTKAASIIFKGNYKWSASTLNRYLSCNLRLVPGKLCRIDEKEEYEEYPSPKTSGSFMHDMVKQVIEEADRRRTSRFDTALQELHSIIDRELAYGASRLSRGMPCEIWEFVSEGYSALLKEFAENELAYLTGPGACFSEHMLEVRLSDDGGSQLPLKSTSISYIAAVDRVDIKDGRYAAVYDYKTGAIPKKEEDLQIEFYSLLTARVLGKTPIASLYFPIKKGNTKREKIELGEYMEEFRGELGLKKYNPRNKSLIPFKADDLNDKLSEMAAKVENVVDDIRMGKFLQKMAEDSCGRFSICNYCIKKDICWHRWQDEAEEA